MGTKDVIGNIDCPVCGQEMPVKEDKNQHAYGHCAHGCNAQVFTRNDHRDALLRKRMRAVTVTDTVPPPDVKPDPVHIPVFVPPPAPATKKPDPAPPAPQPAPAPTKPEPKKSNWLSPVMGGVKHGRA